MASLAACSTRIAGVASVAACPTEGADTLVRPYRAWHWCEQRVGGKSGSVRGGDGITSNDVEQRRRKRNGRGEWI